MPAAGNIVGSRYRLERLLAEGGMGAVWLAVHTSLLKPVAVKFLKTVDRADARERFLREIRIAASIRHPHVATLLDEGVTDDGQMYMVLEYLEGESLGARLTKEPPLSIKELARIVRQTLSALASVHEIGVVHRDLKPENVFLVPHEEGPYVKLLDFGIARTRPASDLALPSDSLTVTGCTVGTPWYMAPEQARGRDLDGRADLFSLGVIMYRALSGRYPFEGLTLADVMLSLVSQKPTPLVDLRPELGAPLSDLVARALDADPQRRFASAKDMRDALDQLAPALPDATTVTLSTPARAPRLDAESLFAFSSEAQPLTAVAAPERSEVGDVDQAVQIPPTAARGRTLSDLAEPVATVKARARFLRRIPASAIIAGAAVCAAALVGVAVLRSSGSGHSVSAAPAAAPVLEAPIAKATTTDTRAPMKNAPTLEPSMSPPAQTKTRAARSPTAAPRVFRRPSF